MDTYQNIIGPTLMIFDDMVSTSQRDAVEILRYIVKKMENFDEEDVKLGWNQLLHWADKGRGAFCNDCEIKLKLASPEEAKTLLEEISPKTVGDVFLLEAVRLLKKHFRIWVYENNSD